MIPYTETGDGITFKVQVVPRASRSEIVGEHNGALRLRIAAAPIDGAANEVLIRTLAMGFRVSRSAVQIIAGHGSKVKQLMVSGVGPEALEALIDQKSR